MRCDYCEFGLDIGEECPLCKRIGGTETSQLDTMPRKDDDKETSKAVKKLIEHLPRNCECLYCLSGTRLLVNTDTRCRGCGDTYCWGGKHCSARDKGNCVTRWVGNMWAKVKGTWS